MLHHINSKTGEILTLNCQKIKRGGVWPCKLGEALHANNEISSVYVNLMEVGEFSGHRLYTGLRLSCRRRLCGPISTLCAISAVGELFVEMVVMVLTCRDVEKSSCAV